MVGPFGLLAASSQSVCQLVSQNVTLAHDYPRVHFLALAMKPCKRHSFYENATITTLLLVLIYTSEVFIEFTHSKYAWLGKLAQKKMSSSVAPILH